jgi:Mg-chelatase subunit ChlD
LTAVPGERPYLLYLPSVSRYACRADPRPIDLVLVLDTSTTMLGRTSDGRTKLDVAIEASLGFAAALEPDKVRLALVEFNSEALVLLPMTNDRQAIARALEQVTVEQGSRIDLGLASAGEVLGKSEGSQFSRQAVVLLTDGRPVGVTAADVRRAARQLTDPGIVLYVVAVGENADRGLLSTLVTAEHRFLDAEDGSLLERVYADIVALLDCP